MACLVDADCGAPVSWCEQQRFCNTQDGTCATWPTCHNAPWLACDVTNERCLQLPLAATAGPPSQVSTATIVMSILLSLLAVVLVAVAGWVYWIRDERHYHHHHTRLASARDVDAEVNVHVRTLPKDTPML